MKLSAKFARQEDEIARLARIARRRVSDDRAGAIRRMLGLTEAKSVERQSGGRELPCPHCHRRFRLAMHLGRHLSATHQGMSNLSSSHLQHS